MYVVEQQILSSSRVLWNSPCMGCSPYVWKTCPFILLVDPLNVDPARFCFFVNWLPLLFFFPWACVCPSVACCVCWLGVAGWLGAFLVMLVGGVFLSRCAGRGKAPCALKTVVVLGPGTVRGLTHRCDSRTAFVRLFRSVGFLWFENFKKSEFLSRMQRTAQYYAVEVFISLRGAVQYYTETTKKKERKNGDNPFS